MKIPIDIKIVSQREHSRLNWALREARKSVMAKAVRDALLVESLPRDPLYQAVEIGIPRSVPPEGAFFAPIVSVLRDDQWISESASVVITPVDGDPWIYFDPIKEYTYVEIEA